MQKIFLLTFLLFLFSTDISLGQERHRIAVLTLGNHAKLKSEEIEHLTNIIRQNLATDMGKNYLVMTQENILTLLPDNKKIEDCLDECEVDVGRNLGASLIVTGSILIFNKNYRLNIKVHDTKDGALLASEISKGNNLDAVEESIIISTGKLINSIKKIKEENVNENKVAVKIDNEVETELEDITHTLPTLPMVTLTTTKDVIQEKEIKQKNKNEIIYQIKEEFKEKEKSDKKKIKNIDFKYYDELPPTIPNIGWGLSIGAGLSLSYSGIGNQLGVSYTNAFSSYRLFINYGKLQYEAQDSIPGLGMQVYFGESSFHNIGFGVNFVSIKSNKSQTFTITSFDLIYRIDMGDLNGFEILVGPSLEIRNTNLIDEHDQIKNITDIVGTFILGLNYMFK